MFKFIKNLIPVSRKRYIRETEFLKADVHVLENKVDKYEKKNDEDKKLLENTIETYESIFERQCDEIKRLNNEVSWAREMLEAKDKLIERISLTKICNCESDKVVG